MSSNSITKYCVAYMVLASKFEIIVMIKNVSFIRLVLLECTANCGTFVRVVILLIHVTS